MEEQRVFCCASKTPLPATETDMKLSFVNACLAVRGNGENNARSMPRALNKRNFSSDLENQGRLARQDPNYSIYMEQFCFKNEILIQICAGYGAGILSSLCAFLFLKDDCSRRRIAVKV